MQINFTVWGTGPTITNNKLRYKAYEAQAPTVEVASLTEDPPHTFPHPVTINVPNPVVHIIKIYSTPDESTGILVSEFIYKPNYTNVEVRAKLELMVNGSGEFDPVSGTQSLPVNTSLRGWDWYPEMRSKSGTLHNTEYTKTESVSGEGYDSFSLHGDDRFTSPDYIFIHFEPKISISQPVFTYLNLFNGIKTITGSETMDSTYYHKLCEIATNGPSPVIQLLPKANIPDNTLMIFSTKRGSQKQATLKAAVGESIECDNTTYPALFMGQGEVLWILNLEGKLRVANEWNGMQRVGIQCDIEVIRPNIILFNGGGLLVGGNPAPLPRTQYPRADWYVNSILTPSQLLTKAARDAGGLSLSGFWAIDDDNIWAPDYRGHQKRTLPGARGNDSTRDANSLPGSYGPDLYKEHSHFTVTSENMDSNSFPPGVSPVKAMPSQWILNGGDGVSYYLPGSSMTPTLAPSSKTGGAETVGKTNGVLVGCYI